MSNNYRRCAGAVVFNKDGCVFLGKRIGIDGAWQFPVILREREFKGRGILI